MISLNNVMGIIRRWKNSIKLEIEVFRNSTLKVWVSWGVLFKGLGVQKGTQTPCWLRPWSMDCFSPAVGSGVEGCDRLICWMCICGIFFLRIPTIFSSKCSMAMEEMSRSSWRSSWARGGFSVTLIKFSTRKISSTTWNKVRKFVKYREAWLICAFCIFVFFSNYL